MNLKLHHLQFAKPYLFTHVTSNKVDDSQPVGLGHRALKTIAIYPSNRAWVSRQSVIMFFFLERDPLVFYLGGGGGGTVLGRASTG